MRRWLGIALLGFVAAVVGGIAGAVLTATAAGTSDDRLGVSGPLLAGQGVAVVLLIGGAIAVLVGLLGAGVTAVRGERPPAP